MIALLIMTDGRIDCLKSTLNSVTSYKFPTDDVGEVWIHDDSGDPVFGEWLHRGMMDRYSVGGLPWRTITAPGRSGFGGAIRNAWSTLAAVSQADHIFHLEDDFLFNRPVPLRDMVTVLDANPDLVQLALRRQAWNHVERAAGGLVESRADQYQDCSGLFPVPRPRLPHEVDYVHFDWLEHRLFFTTNPSLYRRSLIDEGWPEGANSEGMFTLQLLAAHPEWRFGFWGKRSSGRWVHHIGEQRVGTGY